MSRVLACPVCGELLLTSQQRQWPRQYALDIVLGSILFVGMNAILALSGRSVREQFLSAPMLLARLYFVGLPLAIVGWKWFRLMREIDPDYNALWRTYWQAQLTIFACVPLLSALAFVIVSIARAILGGP